MEKLFTSPSKPSSFFISAALWKSFSKVNPTMQNNLSEILGKY